MSGLPTRADINKANEIRQRLRDRCSISIGDLMFMRKIELGLKTSTSKQRRLAQWKRLLSADCS